MKYIIYFTLLQIVVFQIAKADAPASRLKENQKYDVLQIDQVDSTDTLAIPIDESEVEDEQQINRNANKQIFSLPKSK